MILFIQIPCLNEEKTLPLVVRDLPRRIEGVSDIRLVVIDDGSTDGTVRVARELGVDYVLKNARNRGLAVSFFRGLELCAALGADVIVNTDGDNQYRGADVATLVTALVEKDADIVVGCRDIERRDDFTLVKKAFQRIGSRLVRSLSHTTIPDATSGFRAFSRRYAVRAMLTNRFSYTIESLIHAGRTGLRVDWVPVGTNPSTRPSRLFRSNASFMKRQAWIMLSAYLFYCPLRFFGQIALVFAGLAVLGSIRLSYYLHFLPGDFHKFKTGTGLFIIVCLIIGVLFLVSGLIGTVLSGIRQIAQETSGLVKSANREEILRQLRPDLLVDNPVGVWKTVPR